MLNNIDLYLNMTILYLREAKYYYILMFIVFIASFIFCGVIFIAQINLNKVINDTKSKYEIVAYLKEEANRDNFEKAVKEFPNIAEIKFVSQEENKNRLEKEDAKLTELINSLNFNPFPVSYRLILKKEVWSKDRIKDLADFLVKRPEVEEVDFGENNIDSITYSFRNIDLFIEFILYIVVILEILIMLGAAINCHRYLFPYIERFKLLGASKTFIRTPFMFAGVFTGLSASLLSLLLLNIGISYMSNVVYFYPLSWNEILIILASSIVIPIIGNSFSIK
ncbi:hypothetical protein HZA55_02830 [Candidatus Poribacteria bacterium]|nr:hypothetical protein [Candidatus Poribacteria bacterium]